MSAVISILYDDAGHLLSDGAVYTDDGTLTDIREKVFLSPHMPAALTGRGDCKVVEDFAGRLFHLFSDFDVMISMLSRVLNGLEGINLPWELVIVGWSKSQGRPAHYVVTGHAGYRELVGIEPFQIYEWTDPSLFLGSEPTPEMLSACGFEACSAETFEPEKHGLAYMEAMRRTPGQVNHTNPDAAHGYGIGGLCQHTCITATGVTTEVIHRWPDAIGRKIAPHLTAVAA